MGEKQPYPTSAQLDALVLQMYQAGIVYSEAVREFKKKFILTALQDVNWNETKAAPTLRKYPRPYPQRVGPEFPCAPQSRASPRARGESSNAEEDRQLKLIRNMRFVSGR